MNQQSFESQPEIARPVAPDDVIFRINSLPDLCQFASDPTPLKHIGFTGIVISEDIAAEGAAEIASLEQQEFAIHGGAYFGNTVDLATPNVSAEALWKEIEASPVGSIGSGLAHKTGSIRYQAEATTLVQMTTRPVPVVPITPQLIYSSDLREQRELLRSLVFWRKRFEIARQAANLVHAGDDGLLIYTVDSWLVSVNQNDEEVSIDLGSHGSMWLMLGTQRDVHLHGSLLILPPFSGAIVANELAR